jgi:tetratricopeptide (TPR) repeat protein
MAQDRQGLVVSGSAASAAALDQVINDFYAWTGDILGDLDHAVKEDPGFALGYAAIATILMLGGFRGDYIAVTGAIAAARARATSATPRERAHIAIAEALARGQLRDAVRLCEAILRDYPRDALALRYASDLHYYLGDSTEIRDSAARVLSEWRDNDPIFGFVLGRYAFGLEESGALDRAVEIGQRALAFNPRDAWATHAVAHVYEMSGRTDEGIRFLEDTRANWAVGKWLAVHNGWHLALFLIEAGRGDEVLARYDSFVQPRLKENFILDLVDAGSLLWRLELTGVDVGSRWREVGALAASRIGEHVLAFNDLHVALATVGGRDTKATQRLLDSLDRYLAEGNGDNRAVTADVGRPLVVAMAAFGEADYRRTIDLLLPLRHEVIRIGGSHAQREVVEQTLITAAIRSEDWILARSLLAERVTLYPSVRSRHLYESIGANIAKA